MAVGSLVKIRKRFFFCHQHDFLLAMDALFSTGDQRISCCGNLISKLISGPKKNYKSVQKEGTLPWKKL